MKKFLIPLAALAVFILSGCNTSTAERSYELGEAGKFDTTLAYVAPKSDLKEAATAALTSSRYSVRREGDGLRATLDGGGIHTSLLLTFEDDFIHINAKGSNVEGRPLMPIRRIDSLRKRIQKNLARIQKNR